MDQERLVEYVEAGAWKSHFDGSALAEGQKLARARQVGGIAGEVLDTGDLELVATVTEKDGTEHKPALAFWDEDGSIQLDGSCRCDVGTNCHHAVAILENLLKAPQARLAKALGDAPQDDEISEAKTLLLDEPDEPETVGAPDSSRPTFILRLEKRPGGDGFAWLPDILGHAFAVYGKLQVPLDPSGNLLPIVTAEEKIHRNRAAEMEALQTLYALDLRPGAEEPPASLKKVERPGFDGTLWQVDQKKWQHPELFWQRFRHEGCPALERRHWEVQFAPGVGMVPLIFKTETWRAEIVEEGKGWFRLSAGFDVNGEPFELQPILASLVANNFLEATEGLSSGQEFLIFLPDGRGLALPVGRFRRIMLTLGQLMEFPFIDGRILLNKLDAALLAAADGNEEAEGEEPTFGIETMPEIEELARRVSSFEKIDRVPVPVGLEATLRDYQLDGFHWMQFLAQYGLHGILADDMGLGKTMQTLCHILAEKESGRNEGKPTLVMAPTSVVVNWQREAAMFAPGLKVLVLQGADRKRRFREIPEVDLVLTSYALLARDLEVFSQHEFHLFALDEAQHIKNPGAQVSAAVREVSSTHRLCLSGTPVENHLGELWSLMDFLMPGLLGTQDSFTSTYRTPIEKGGDGEKAEQLAKRVGPLILRRTKHDVAKELPPKTEIPHLIQLEGEQQDLYETVRSTMDKQVRQALALKGTESQIVFLDALLKLRQICCHPDLLKRDEEEQDNKSARSSKFDYLVDLLATLRSEGHRTLLFSQFTSMLSILEEHLNAVDCPYLILTGATKDRQGLVERWQGGEGEVFLISLKAGGTGLTLTGADTVIHYDPWWNPAAENQATDRAYRIGQDKPVFVHKLICKDTVEERIQQMQGKKDDIATDLLRGATHSLSLDAQTMAELLG